MHAPSCVTPFLYSLCATAASIFFSVRAVCPEATPKAPKDRLFLLSFECTLAAHPCTYHSQVLVTPSTRLLHPFLLHLCFLHNRFYSYGLEKNKDHINKDIYRDFEEATIRDFERGSLYGLEKFWAFHHYSGLPKDSDIEIHPRLKALLQNEYKDLDCFRRENQRRAEVARANGIPIPTKTSHSSQHHNHNNSSHLKPHTTSNNNSSSSHHNSPRNPSGLPPSGPPKVQAS